MKTLGRSLFVWILFLFVSACSSTLSKPEGKRPELNLETARTFSPGKSDEASVRERLGAPDQVLDSPERRQAWIYFDHPYRQPRFSFIFDANGLLDSTNFFVKENDSETHLPEAKAKFPGADFKVSEPEWSNPHEAPAQDIYSDDRLGIDIVHLSVSNRVEGVVMRKPGSKSVATRSSK